MVAGAAPARARWRVGRYVILERLGRGGMGMVYRALDESLERELAIKVLTAEGLRDPASRRRFEIEAKAAAQLQHPNIVTIYELGEERGVPFIAMELLGGTDLDALMRTHETLLLEEKVHIALQICRGLTYAHERHIVHRDIKPSNLRLLDDGTVKIVDFGIAKLGGVNLTQSGMVVGTVHYMSPEQVRGQPLDGRSDLFSLGVILFELLQGVRPFEGGTASEILYKIVHAPLPSLTLDDSPRSPALRRVVERALARSVDERYPSAEAMAQDLADILGEQALEDDKGATPGVVDARRLLGAGRVDDSIGCLTAIVTSHPHALDARRALRAARRVRAVSPARDATIEADLTELAATFGAAPPVSPEPGSAKPARASAPSSSWRQPLLWIGAALAALALGAGSLLLWTASGRQGTPAPIEVRSSPAEARILINGQDTGLRTAAEITPPAGASELVLTLRKDGFRDHVESVAVPRADPGPLVVALAPVETTMHVMSAPPGARVLVDGAALAGVTPRHVALGPGAHTITLTLDGHEPVTRRFEGDERSQDWSAELLPLGPPAEILVQAPYDVEISAAGRALAQGSGSLRLSLPAGTHVLSIVSATHFLRVTRRIEAIGGQRHDVALPATGSINVQARPDNCEIHIDGFFADYPPILNRAIAAGVHKVRFRWPDGAVQEETVEIDEGLPKFVTGRKP